MNKPQTKLELIESRVITNINQIKENIFKLLGVEPDNEGNLVISFHTLINLKEYIQKDVKPELEFVQYILVK